MTDGAGVVMEAGAPAPGGRVSAPGAGFGSFTLRLVTNYLLFLLRIYQATISKAMPPICKYHPSCSRYAFLAIQRRGPLVGAALAAWRLLRCNPLSRGGYDPVPWPRPRRRPAGREH